MLAAMKTQTDNRTFRIHRLLPLLAAAALLAFTSTAFAQDAAALLEKGVYTEETRGDITAALAIYEQALEAAQASESLAAQALYRMASCHLKQNDTAGATALLERIIEDYPEQEDWVARARLLLPDELNLLPAPWRNGEVMILNLRFPAGTKVGMSALFANLSSAANRQVWIVGRRLTAVGNQIASSVTTDALTFQPLKSHWKHSVIGEASAEFQPGLVKITSADGSLKEVPLDKTVWDNEQVLHLIRRLPLEAGYKATVRILSTLGGGAVIPIVAEVTGREEIEVPAGKFNTWKVVLQPVQQAFWYSADEHKYLVKMEAGGIVGELARVEHRVPGEPNIHGDPDLGFSLRVPRGWFIYEAEADKEERKKALLLLDPKAAAINTLGVQPITSLPEDARTLRSWAENRAEHGSKFSRDYKVRPDSWTELEVGGYPALSFVADFTETGSGKAMVHYSVVVFSPSMAANFFSRVPRDRFEAFKPELGQVIGGFIISE